MSAKRLGLDVALITNQEANVKFMLISYATKDWEAGLPPDPRLVAAILRLYEKMPKGASLLSTGGLAPSSMGSVASQILTSTAFAPSRFTRAPRQWAIYGKDARYRHDWAIF